MGGEARTLQPGNGAAAGIYLDGEGDETEYSRQGEEPYAYPYQVREYIYEKDPGKQHPLDGVVCKRNHGNHGAA